MPTTRSYLRSKVSSGTWRRAHRPDRTCGLHIPDSGSCAAAYPRGLSLRSTGRWLGRKSRPRPSWDIRRWNRLRCERGQISWRYLSDLALRSSHASEDYLTGVVRGLSLVSRTKTASSFAGSVLLALRLIEWIAPGGSDQLSPAR